MSYTVERLIIEIKSRPAIWDSRTKEYSKKNNKTKCLGGNVCSVGTKLEAKPSAEKCPIGTTIQKKWKSISDAFSRELKKNHLKSGSGAKTSKPYAYFNNLLFLKSLYEKKPKKEHENTDVNKMINIEDNDDSKVNLSRFVHE